MKIDYILSATTMGKGGERSGKGRGRGGAGAPT